MQLVIFKIREEFFGVEASKVLSINDMMTITKVPNAPSYIKGLINLRGIIISLFDISILLNLDHRSYDNVSLNDSSVIILDIEFEEIGIIVDKVDEVVDIDPNFIKITVIDINKFVPKDSGVN